MGFKESVEADNLSSFLSLDEFGETRTVRVSGTEYADIPVLLHSVRSASREASVRKYSGMRTKVKTDHAQGLYREVTEMDVRLSDIGGVLPEKGMRIAVSEAGGAGYFMEFYVFVAYASYGLARIELEALDE